MSAELPWSPGRQLQLQTPGTHLPAALLAELPDSTQASPCLLELFPFKLKVVVISQICEASSSHAATSSFKAVLRAANDITNLTDRLYLSPAVSPGERRCEVGTELCPCSPDCHWQTEAKALDLPQSRRPTRWVTGRKEKGGSGVGEREEAGTRRWGTAQRGSGEVTAFLGGLGTFLRPLQII